MRAPLVNKLSHFEKDDFLPRKEIWEPIAILLAWALPAFVFVLWVNAYYPENEFYKAAINEGIGPNLWNAIGSFGVFSFGVTVVLSSYYMPSLITKQILLNTYAIGCLTFGLLVGQWCLLPFDELVWWQQGLFGITSVFLLLVVFIYNSVTWYLSFLIQNHQGKKSNFLINLEKIHWAYKTILGLFISFLSMLVFLSA